MYFLLILFFISLFGIIFMIGRKLAILPSGHIFHEEETHLKASLEEWKYLTTKTIKKYSFVGLVVTIRLYVRSTNFLKNKLEDLKIKIKSIRGKKLNEKEEKEVNGFLKMISEYKHKIREIKHKIKEEENL